MNFIIEEFNLANLARLVDHHHSGVATLLLSFVLHGVGTAPEATASVLIATVAKSANCALQWSERTRRASAAVVEAEPLAPELQASPHQCELAFVSTLDETATCVLTGLVHESAACVIVFALVGAACGHIKDASTAEELAECGLLGELECHCTTTKE